MEKIAFTLICSETKAVLPSAYYQSANRVSFKENPPEARLVGKTGQLGNRARRIRHRIPLEDLIERAILVNLAEFHSFLEEEEVSQEETWVACVDGSSTRKYSGAGVILKFITFNNKGNYKAIIAGTNMAQEMGVKNLEIRSDSQVVVGHIKGEFVTTLMGKSIN
jgi:hypothetical protein